MYSQYHALDSGRAQTNPPQFDRLLSSTPVLGEQLCPQCQEAQDRCTEEARMSERQTLRITVGQLEETPTTKLDKLRRELKAAKVAINQWMNPPRGVDNLTIATAFTKQFADKTWGRDLYTLLHHETTGAYDPAKMKLLEHPVMRLVVHLGWRAFGLRMYCEQLFMHLLLLLTLTVSLGLSLGTATGPKFEKVFMFWLVCTPLLLLSLLATRFLTWKNKAPCAWLTLVLWYGVTMGLMINYDTLLELLESQTLPKATDLEWFGRINNVLLGLSALYFCIFELRELRADPERTGSTLASIFNLLKGDQPSPYLESYWNRVQLPTFFLVLVYVGCEFTAPFSDAMRVYAGIPMLFVLFIMCVQYLEVFPAVGYLLPMMRRMLADVACYLVFYFPIQCAYASAYYLLFKSQGDHLKPYEPEPAFASNFTSAIHYLFPSANVPNNAATMALLEVLKTKDKNDIFQGYETVPKSFLTTYLVTFGQINLEPFDQLASPTAYVLGYLLLVTHATIVIVMLLNVLIAMMNKTVDAHFAEDKAQACVTFTECVFRMSKVDTLPEHTESDHWEHLGFRNLCKRLMGTDDRDMGLENKALLDAIKTLNAKVDELQSRQS